MPPTWKQSKRSQGLACGLLICCLPASRSFTLLFYILSKRMPASPAVLPVGCCCRSKPFPVPLAVWFYEESNSIQFIVMKPEIQTELLRWRLERDRQLRLSRSVLLYNCLTTYIQSLVSLLNFIDHLFSTSLSG